MKLSDIIIKAELTENKKPWVQFSYCKGNKVRELLLEMEKDIIKLQNKNEGKDDFLAGLDFALDLIRSKLK